MPQHLDYHYIEGILKNDAACIKKIYTQYLPLIEHLILKNKGTKDDAWEIFQEALIIVLKNAHRADFELSSTFKVYLYGIARNLWRTELDKKFRSAEVTISDTIQYIDDADLEQAIFYAERQQLYIEKLNTLGDRCQEILRLFFQKMKMSEIATQMGYQSEGSARKQKHQCQEQLIERVQQDARFGDL